ncbi:DUF924 domain-containing protein [Cardiobacteriaceae bacterium TAE3-ERU3]|nr:DUF924 domain-containing protein [Cardiobacteriaceae bacterium TAE3-ERU3]
MQPQTVLDFWFKDIDKSLWFRKDDEFDATIRERFGALTESAHAGELYVWRGDIYGRLAEIIVLDQFSRNIWRDDARAFASDSMALVLAQEAIKQPDYDKLDTDQRSFLLMPYMHSESAAIHEQAMQLFATLDAPSTYAFEQKHKAIIDRFGRYPHRNGILNRSSTPEEIEFLKQPGSGF